MDEVDCVKATPELFANCETMTEEEIELLFSEGIVMVAGDNN